MKPKVVFLLILFLGFFLRIYDLNWDANNHLHPDERFLTMVGNAEKIPANLSDYFNPQKSTLNPTNIGYSFFVYGNLPLMANKLLAIATNNDNYNAFTLQGRCLSAIADFFCIVLIYKIIFLLEKKYRVSKNVKLYGTFFYAISVLPIQLAHFFTVDTFLNFFMLMSFYQALKYFFKQKKIYLIFCGMSFGLALACKINAIFILPLILIFFFNFKKLDLLKTLLTMALFGAVAFLSFYIVDPYKFNFLFIENLKTLKSFESQNIWYPPGVQWMNKLPVVFALVNLTFFGVGLFYFIFIILGGIYIFQKKIFSLQIVYIWVVLFFLYQSTQFVKTMRYFIFIYPFLAIFAAFGLEKILSIFQKIKTSFLCYALQVISFALLLIWPLMFFSIYTQDHSRVTASKWIYDNVQPNKKILYEYWDDALPLPITNQNKIFNIEAVAVFDPDTPEKWQKINSQLQQADYYVLSSNRGWGSISSVSQKYPLMSKFYGQLFENKTNYKIVKEFTSYPSLRWLGIPLDFPDQWSEEAFTVYDHPQVMIFKRQ